jgi:hypothetical protein
LFRKGPFKTGPEVLPPLARQQKGEAFRRGSVSQQLAKGCEVVLEAAEVFDLAIEGGIVAVAGGEMVAAACEEDRVGSDSERRGWIG